MPKAIGDGFGDTEDLDRDAFNRCHLDVLGQESVREPNDAQRWLILRGPIVLADCYPDGPRQLIGELVKRERGCKADNTFGKTLRRFRPMVAAVMPADLNSDSRTMPLSQSISFACSRCVLRPGIDIKPPISGSMF